MILITYQKIVEVSEDDIFFINIYPNVNKIYNKYFKREIFIYIYMIYIYMHLQEI